jgi:hypothetical protein
VGSSKHAASADCTRRGFNSAWTYLAFDQAAAPVHLPGDIVIDRPGLKFFFPIDYVAHQRSDFTDRMGASQ